MLRKTLAAVARLVALVALVACGSPEEPTPSGRSMGAPVEAVGAAERSENRAPTVDAVALIPKSPRKGIPIDAAIETSDPDGDGVRVQVAWLVNGRVVPGATQPRLRTGDLEKGDRIELRVVATDGLLESAPYVVRTSMANRPPGLQGVGFASDQARPGDPIVASPVASDPDGDTLRFRYAWYVNDRKTSQSGERFDTGDLKRGDRVHVEVIASDRSDQTGPVRSSPVVILNSPPQIEQIPAPRIRDGEFVYAFRARDPDGDKNLRFRLAQAPRGMTIDALGGQARWRPDSTQVGSHAVEVVVEDSYGDGGALRFDVTVQLDAPPAAAR